nr:MAG TPA: hypothetical protein [Bacteriophage sp.]
MFCINLFIILAPNVKLYLLTTGCNFCNNSSLSNTFSAINL